ncbi:MAG: metal-dependent hydrolase [Candidatus Levybacteria bacterium]|nr:metal-dependent hydrolase [Candidatus Levybacteria bacterium]
MTGRTHDLAAFTALSYVMVTTPFKEITLATAIVAFTANMVGGLAPDLDQSTASLWHRVRGGSMLGKIIAPLLGGHRFLSHSLVGIFIAGILARMFLQVASSVLYVDIDIVWWAFMIGFISHLFMDLFTHDGIPLLFPIPLKLGIPPLSFLRIKTGGLVEKSFVFPVLLFITICLYYFNYHDVLHILRNLS